MHALQVMHEGAGNKPLQALLIQGTNRQQLHTGKAHTAFLPFAEDASSSRPEVGEVHLKDLDEVFLLVCL